MYSTQSNNIVFKFPHGHNAKSKQFQFMDFSISPFFEGIRLVTPSEAWHDNSDILVTEKFLKRFTFPVDNPEGRGEGEAEFVPQYIHQTGLINNLNYLILKQLWRIAKKLSSLSLKTKVDLDDCRRQCSNLY